MQPALARIAGVRAAESPFSIYVDRGDNAATFTTDGINRHVVIRTGTLDLLEAPTEVRRRQVDMFEDLLAGLEARFQLLVTSRAAAAFRPRDPRISDWLKDRAREHPSYTRRVHLVLSDAAPGIERLGDRWRAMRNRPVRAGLEVDGTADLLRQAEGVVQVLRTMGLAPALVAGRALDRFLDVHLPAVMVRPGAACDWLETARHLWLDDRFHRTFFLDAYPGTELAAGWLGHLLDLPAEYDLAIHGFKVPAASVMRLLNVRIRNLQATRMADAAAAAVSDPLAEAGLPEAIGLRRDIAANEQHAYTLSVYLTLTADDEAALDAIGRAAADASARSMARLLPATLQMAAGRLCTLPLGADPITAQRLLPSGVVATLYPWLWDELQQPGGHLVGFRIRGGTPVMVDTFDEERFANANVGVFGHSGAGKTFLMKSLLLADAAAGTGAFIVDPEAEYRGLCEQVGGQWVDLALGSGASVNVLDPALAAMGERDPVGDQVIDLVDLVSTMCAGLTEDDRVDLDEALREVLARMGGTLADVRHLLDVQGRAPRVVRSLRRWTEGQLGSLFAAPTNVRLSADFVVFGLRDLKEEVLPVAYFLIAQWIWARVRSQPSRRRLLFDEVGLLFEYPLVRKFLVRLARRARKYQGSLCLVTQNAGDLLSSDQGLVLATNPSTVFLGAQRQAEAQRLQRALGLTDGQADFLASAARGQFLLVAGETRHRIRTAAPPWHDEVLRPLA
ncbi:MAG: hypothetical protein WBD38_05310 [Candidatus Dormiibacterota bacterium]